MFNNRSHTNARDWSFNAALMYFFPAFPSTYARRLQRRLRNNHGHPGTLPHVSSRLASAVSRVPSLVSFLIFVTIYIVIEIVLAVLNVPIFKGWKPAFPLSWRFILVLLLAVPIFTFTQVLRLLLPLLVNRWNGSADLSHSYVMLRRDDTISRPVVLFNAEEEENALLEDAEEVSERSSRPASPCASHTGPHHKQWWIQFIIYVLLFVVSTWIAVRYERPGDVRYRSSVQSAVAHPRREGYGRQEKILIAAIFYNNEQVIPYWHRSLIQVIHYLGPDNVFVSIVESYSTDDSSQLLKALDAELMRMDVPRRILVGDETVPKPDDMSGNNRIEFLAATRNHALEPLMEGGYDKVVFSNDIYIEPESWVELLETNDGDYDMACGMDFSNFGAYDMWVLRDRQGKLVSAIWPYFFDEADYHAMQTESPVPVFTCWNGIVVFTADPVLPIALRSNHTLSSDPLPYILPSTHPAAHDASMRGPSPALTPPIRFRASAPEECYSSESFLLPYDLRRQFNLQHIYVNSRVINGYKWRYYVYFKWLMRHPVLRWWIEKVYNGAWMSRSVLVVGDAADVYWWDGGDCHPWW